jgi:hypothetical protein
MLHVANVSIQLYAIYKCHIGDKHAPNIATLFNVKLSTW